MTLELPHRWASVPIADIVRVKETDNPKNRGTGSFRYVDIDALNNVRGVIDAPKDLPVAEAPSRARVVMRKGDVLFSLVRPYLKNIAIVPDDLDGEFASTAFCPIRPAPGVESGFLFHLLRQDSFISSIPTYGNSPPAARDDEFLAMPVPLAPEQEQRRIVAKIEELFSDLDAGVAALERVRIALKRYRAAVLKAAVEGRLTEQWREERPHVEPANELLRRILAERRERWEREQLAKYEAKGKKPPSAWRKQYKPAESLTGQTLWHLPPGWCWSTVDAVAFVTKLAGFEYTKYVKYTPDGDLAVIKAENAGKWGFKETDYSLVSSDSVWHLQRSALDGGELLMVFVGAGTGQVAIVPTGRKYFLGPNIAMLRVRSRHVLPRYLEMFLRSGLGHQLALSLAKAVAQPRAAFTFDGGHQEDSGGHSSDRRTNPTSRSGGKLDCRGCQAGGFTARCLRSGEFPS